MIAILVPSRARPWQCKRLIESIIPRTSLPVTVYLAVSEEDHDRYQLPQSDRIRIRRSIMPENMPTVHKWNLLAEYAVQDGHKLLMLGADDMIFSTPLWDKALMEHYDGLDCKIHAYAL